MLVFDKETAQLPGVMTDVPQWVNWRYESGPKGERRKVPYNPHTLRHASSTNPRTWSTYAHAVSQTTDKTGLGFVFTPPWIGVDFDHCVLAPHTAEKVGDVCVNSLTPVIEEILDRFPDTYVEYSPSGTGLHMFLHGVLSYVRPRGFHGPLGEVYTHGRFFTVTGKPWRKDTSPCSIMQVSHTELSWLLRKLTPVGTQPELNGFPTTADYNSTCAPLGKDSSLWIHLCETIPKWESTWARTRLLEGKRNDQSASAYEMSLTRLAVRACDDQEMYALLVGWRIEHDLEPQRHEVLVSTIDKAHQAFEKDTIAASLVSPDQVTQPERLARLSKILQVPLRRLVQLGSGVDDPMFRCIFADGAVKDIGDYTAFNSYIWWKQIVWAQARKELDIEKKEWPLVCTFMRACLEYEASTGVSPAAETAEWLDNYVGGVSDHDADASTLRKGDSFKDEEGYHVQLDKLLSHIVLQYKVKISRAQLANRLAVINWCEKAQTRLDDVMQRSVTKIYWGLRK